MTKKRPRSADGVTLETLAYEFASDDCAEAEGKIRRKLRYHGLGPYEPERVALLRGLKNEVQRELLLGRDSRHFVGSRGRYAVMEDWDVEQMVRELAEVYPEVPREEIAAFVSLAIYVYYLR